MLLYKAFISFVSMEKVKIKKIKRNIHGNKVLRLVCLLLLLQWKFSWPEYMQ